VAREWQAKAGGGGGDAAGGRVLVSARESQAPIAHRARLPRNAKRSSCRPPPKQSNALVSLIAS